MTKQWQERKAQAITSTMSDALRVALKQPWPVGEITMTMARLQCRAIAAAPQYHDAASNAAVKATPFDSNKLNELMQ